MGSLYDENLKELLQVEIISEKLIRPSSPTPKQLQNYELSFFDQIAEAEHVPAVLFYPHNSRFDIEHDKIDEQLEQSLSRILTRVYPIAGRVTEDQCSIVCLDQGVTYIKAKVNCKFDDFLKQARKDLDLATLFWPQCIKDVNDTNFHSIPLFIAQVTKFECGGIALSISASHSVMDGYTSLTFVYEWTKVCRSGIPAEEINVLSFNFGGTIFPTRDLTGILEPHIDYQEEDVKYVSKMFVIDEVAISRLKEKLASSMGSGALSFKPTRIEIITALVWRALIRASEAINGHLRPSLMCLPMNLRGKTSLSLKENAFGNYIIDAPIKFVPETAKVIPSPSTRSRGR